METPNQVKNTPVTLTSQLDYKYDLGATIQLYDYLQQFLKAIIPNNKKKEERMKMFVNRFIIVHV